MYKVSLLVDAELIFCLKLFGEEFKLANAQLSTVNNNPIVVNGLQTFGGAIVEFLVRRGVLIDDSFGLEFHCHNIG